MIFVKVQTDKSKSVQVAILIEDSTKGDIPQRNSRMNHIRRMNANEVQRILQNNGFEFVSQKGSHRKWRNSYRQLQVIVPYHKGRDLSVGTLRDIMVKADIPESIWKW